MLQKSKNIDFGPLGYQFWDPPDSLWDPPGPIWGAQDLPRGSHRFPKWTKMISKSSPKGLSVSFRLGYLQPINKPTNQPTNRQTNQPTNPPNQPNQPTNHSIVQPSHLPFSNHPSYALNTARRNARSD